jgi:hypothetical protein
MRVILVLMLATTAHAGTIDDAFPPTVRVGTPSHGKLDAISIERGELVWITLRLSGRATANTVVPLDLPAGAHVVGVEVARGDKVVWGRPLARRLAAVRFEHAVAPTLVTWTGTSGDVDHLELRVSCVGNSAVVLAVELPATPNLHVEPAELARVDGGRVRGPVAIAASATTARYVDADTSLVAEPDGAIAVAFGTIDGPSEGWRDKSMIRRAMKLRLPALTHCYERIAQAHPDLAGHVDIHMMVEEDGSVSSATVDGELPNDDVKTCMTTVASTIEFPPARDGRTLINWPLDVKPLR